MSLVFTESWMSHAIGAVNIASAVTTTPGADISSSIFIANLSALDWRFHIRANSATTGYGLFELIQDPIEASKQRIHIKSYRGSGAANTIYSQLFMSTIRTMPTKYVFGALIRLESTSMGGYVSFRGYGAGAGLGSGGTTGGTAATAGVLNFLHTTATDSDTWTITSYASGSLQTVTTMNPVSGVDYYMEMQVDTVANTFRVWIDDLLILDTTLSTAVSALMTSGLTFYINNATGTGTAGTAYGVGLTMSDMYCLDVSDTVTPYARLGKTTRVKGEVPASDYSVQMTLPDGYTDHYDVVNDQISSPTATPSVYLTAETAGTRDLFGSGSDASSYASAVHGVVIKSVSANFGETSHVIGGVMSDGTTEAVVNSATLAAASGWDAIFSVHPTAPDGTSWTPAKVAAAKFGVELVS